MLQLLVAIFAGLVAMSLTGSPAIGVVVALVVGSLLSKRN